MKPSDASPSEGTTRRRFVRTAAAALASPGWLPARGPAAAADPLFEAFADPPVTARPFVRWWWNGDKVTREEVLRELDLLKQAGIGGVEINPIRFPNPTDPLNVPVLQWLSEPWIEVLQAAVNGARERGMIADSIIGSGWPFGGEFLKPDEQTEILSLGWRRLAGPSEVRLTERELLAETDLPLHSKNTTVYRHIEGLRLVPARLEKFQPGTDVTGRLRGGVLKLSVPAGEHVLYILTRQQGFQAVINGASGADGPVLNHYDQDAVRRYLDRMARALEPKLGVLGHSFRAMFCDSLELEGANWCADMTDQFYRRRGYRLEPYLPFVLFKTGHMGNIATTRGAAELAPAVEAEVQRVRYDFCRTRIELFTERFEDTLERWCRRHQVKLRVQAYGRGYHPLEASMRVDIPECETWLNPRLREPRHRAWSAVNKFVSSGARFAGQRLVSCEEETNTGMVFNATLDTLKVSGDQSNLSGVTASVFHGFNYSPREAAFPGWVRYGTFFNERNPWWPYLRRWTDYKARVSAVFQRATPRADIAILHPLADIWMRYDLQRQPFPVVQYPEYQYLLWEAIHQNGNGCDYISEGILGRAQCGGGRLEFNGRRYRTLLLMEVETILPETARALEQFAAGGGRILFLRVAPSRSPGFLDQERNDRAVRRAIRRILADHPRRCAVVPPPGEDLTGWYRKLQRRFGIRPYVRLARPDKNLTQIAFTHEGRDIFFFLNSDADRTLRTTATFDTGEKTPWRWDPEAGTRSVYPYRGRKNRLDLRLDPSESLLLVFDPEREGKPAPRLVPVEPGARTLTAPWAVALHHVSGERRQLSLPKLVDFKDDARLRSFAGEIIYSTSFDLAEPDAFRFLDLGKVYGVSQVKLNGRDAGCRWYGRHRYPLEDFAIRGWNRLEVRVVTTLGNYCKTLKDNPVAQRWTRRQPFYPMGLLGPVRLLDGEPA